MSAILVTGGSGFIGSHLCQALHGDVHNVDVRAPVEASEWHPTDVRDCDSLMRVVEGVRPDVIVHLAAIPGVAAMGGLETQILGTKNVLLAADAVGARVVSASSAAVYSLPEYSESTAWISEYAVGKRAAELLAECSPVSCCSLRFGNVYGPPWIKGVVAAFRRAVREHYPPTITDPTLSRDFVHVDDAVRAILAAMVTDYQGPIDVCTGVETTLLDLWSQTCRSWGVATTDFEEGEPRPCDRPSGDQDPGPAWEEIGWKAQVGLNEGLTP